MSLLNMNISTNLSQFLWIFLITLIVVYLIRKFLENRKYPPGPYGLPIIGYIPFVAFKGLAIFDDLEKKYGKIVSIPIGLDRAIIINDPTVAKKVLTNPSALARPTNFNRIIPEGAGFSGINGKDWIEQRRFCVTAMKNLGLGRGEWETMIHDEAVEMVKELKTLKGKPVDYIDLLEFAQANNLLSLLIGRRLLTDRHTPEAKTILEFGEILIRFISATSLSSNLPVFLTRLLAKFKIANLHILVNAADNFESIVRKEIKRHIQTKKPDQKPNFIDYYIDEQSTQKDKDHLFTEDSLVGNITGLFIAAIDTTKSSIHWLLLLTAYFPEVQRKVRQEINDVAGKDRLIHWDERNNFPYTMATINEMLRWAVTVPLFPPRRSTADIPVDNYIIPKDSIIIVNNWKLLRGFGGDPQDFKPERFLKSDGKDTKMENFIPFSTGKRNCPGEHVAMMTIFLFYTCIMQNFEIVCPEGKSICLEDTGSMIIRHAVPQELCFVEK